MSNLQELMQAVTATHRPIAAYTLRITPRGSEVELYGTIRTRRPVGEVRQLVQSMARRRWPAGFSFSVRPQQ